jgi:hypothetical protein
MAATPAGMVEQLRITSRGLYSTNWNDVTTFLTNEWFSRVWIIQEISVAKTVVLRCGFETLSWDTFSDVLDILPEESVSGVFGALSLNAVAFSAFEKGLHHIFQIIQTRQRWKESDGLLLNQALHLSMGFDSTIPQDRIYGILGLSTGIVRQKLPMSYSLNETDLVVKAATYTYISEAAVDELILAGSGYFSAQWPKISGDRLPTWVPDWNTALDMKGIYYSLIEHKCCSHLEPNFFKVGEEERRIGVSAATIDVIDYLSSIWSASALNPTIQYYDSGFKLWNMDNRFRLRILEKIDKTLSAWAEEGHAMASMAKTYSNSTDEQNRLLWRTILTSSTPGPEIDEEEINKILEDFDSLMDFTARESVHDRQDWTEFTQIFTRCLRSLSFILDRRIGLTKNLLLGVVPPGTRPGDHVSVISGSKVPFIIRRTPRSIWLNTNSEGPVFEIVGPCYIDGIMNGELKDQALEFQSIILE